MDPYITYNNNEMDPVLKTVSLQRRSDCKICKGAHQSQNQPVPLRGIKAFCYVSPKICPDFRGGAKKQPVPWHGGTG